MRIHYKAAGMPDPVRMIYVPQKVELDCILLISGKPVYVFSQVFSRVRIIRIMQLFGEFDRMKGMDMEAFPGKAREGFPLKVHGQRPLFMKRDNGPFGMVKFKSELLLQQSVKPETHS